MILFCDTSALIKLYIAEEGSDALKMQLSLTEAVAVCRIAWAEAYAVLSRRAREVPQDARLRAAHPTKQRRSKRPDLGLAQTDN